LQKVSLSLSLLSAWSLFHSSFSADELMLVLFSPFLSWLLPPSHLYLDEQETPPTDAKKYQTSQHLRSPFFSHPFSFPDKLSRPIHISFSAFLPGKSFVFQFFLVTQYCISWTFYTVCDFVSLFFWLFLPFSAVN